MTPPESESDARIAIDDRLRAAGWDPRDKSRVATEVAAIPATRPSAIVDRSRGRRRGHPFTSQRSMVPGLQGHLERLDRPFHPAQPDLRRRHGMEPSHRRPFPSHHRRPCPGTPRCVRRPARPQPGRGLDPHSRSAHCAQHGAPVRTGPARTGDPLHLGATARSAGLRFRPGARSARSTGRGKRRGPGRNRPGPLQVLVAATGHRWNCSGRASPAWNPAWRPGSGRRHDGPPGAPARPQAARTAA